LAKFYRALEKAGIEKKTVSPDIDLRPSKVSTANLSGKNETRYPNGSKQIKAEGQQQSLKKKKQNSKKAIANAMAVGVTDRYDTNIGNVKISSEEASPPNKIETPKQLGKSIDNNESQYSNGLLQNGTKILQTKIKEEIQNNKKKSSKASPPIQPNSYDSVAIEETLIVLTKPHSFEAEQFKILRSSLLFPHDSKPPRTIMVTSALPGDGKTFVSSNLAISIAQNINEHVLLIDCDLRMPDIHKMFGYKNVKGLAEYLNNSYELKDLFLKTMVNKLTLLPGGDPPPNPSELISSQKMSHLIKEVRSRYRDRIIVIDSPPPALTAETQVIAEQVDGILLVVKYGKTPRELVSHVVDQFGKEKLLGVVFNRYELGISSRLGYGKYGYGKKMKYYAQYQQ
jgi:exopolysaccharide/PEP-CTERM locus tyrosine autokinase